MRNITDMQKWLATARATARGKTFAAAPEAFKDIESQKARMRLANVPIPPAIAR